MRKYWCPLSEKTFCYKETRKRDRLINFSQSWSKIPVHLCKFSCQRAAWGVWDAQLSDLVLLPRSHGLLCEVACWEPVGGRRKVRGHLRHPQSSANLRGHSIQPAVPGCCQGRRATAPVGRGTLPLAATEGFFAERNWVYISEFGLRWPFFLFSGWGIYSNLFSGWGFQWFGLCFLNKDICWD